MLATCFLVFDSVQQYFLPKYKINFQVAFYIEMYGAFKGTCVKKNFGKKFTCERKNLRAVCPASIACSNNNGVWVSKTVDWFPFPTHCSTWPLSFARKFYSFARKFFSFARKFYSFARKFFSKVFFHACPFKSSVAVRSQIYTGSSVYVYGGLRKVLTLPATVLLTKI